MSSKIIIEISEEHQQRLDDLRNGNSGVTIEDVASYAMQLGMKIIESGLDSDELIRSLQEPGTGLDLPLIMAKRRSRGEKQKNQDTAMRDFAKNSTIKLPDLKPEDYDIDFD